MPQQNPIHSKLRSWLLVVAIITAAVTAMAVATAQGLGAPAWVGTVLAAQFYAVPIVAASLSRAHLTPDDKDKS